MGFRINPNKQANKKKTKIESSAFQYIQMAFQSLQWFYSLIYSL